MLIRLVKVALISSIAVATVKREFPDPVPGPQTFPPKTIDPVFESQILSMKRFIDIPPITRTTTLDEDEFAEGEEAFFELGTNSENDQPLLALLDDLPIPCVTFLDELSLLVDNHSDRILQHFPRLVYSEEIDGEVLRNISANIHSLVDASGSHRITVSRIVRGLGWMRKWAWTMVVVMEHIASRTGLSMKESELLLISIAPSMHAFLHALFYLEIDFPDLFFGFQNIIMSVGQYHPLYIEDDPVWFIRLTPEFRTDMSTNRPLVKMPVGVPDLDFLQMEWGDDRFEELLVDPHVLVREVSQVFRCPILNRPFRPSYSESVTVMERVSLVMYTLAYFREVDAEYYQQLVLAGLLDFKLDRIQQPLSRIIQMASLMHDYATIRFLIEIFGDMITDKKALLFLITPIDNMANRFVRIRRDQHETLFPFFPEIQDTLTTIANLTRFQLAGYIQFGSVPLTLIFEPLMENLFSSTSGIFWYNNGQYLLTEHTRTQPLLLIGIGRLLGLIVKFGNPGNILSQFIGSSSSPLSSVQESLFFSSEGMRQGFYDVIIQDTFEGVFKVAYNIIENLEFLGREVFVL